MSNTHVTSSAKNAYTSHHCADPSYPQTTIVPKGVNDYDIRYAHGKPLSEFTIDDCPDTVFNYDCQYYKSLLSMKSMYETSAANAKRKLDAHDESLMNAYINDHVDEIYSKAAKRINKSIDTLSSLSAEDLVRDISNDTNLANSRDIANLKADIEAEMDEQQEALSSVEDEVIEDLTAQWYTMYQTSPDNKRADESIYTRWVNGLKEIDNEIKNWKRVALDEAIEYERTQISEFNAIPHNGTEFKSQLRKMTAKLISESTADVKSSAFDVICSKLPRSAVEKYNDQLNTMIMLHKRNRCYSVIDTFMNTFKVKLNDILGRLNINDFVAATDWYELKKFLFPLIESCVNAMSKNIFTEMNDRLSLIQKYTDNISNLQHMSRLVSDVVTATTNVLADYNVDVDVIDDDPSLAKVVDGVDTLNVGFSDNVKRVHHRKPAKAVKCKDDF